MGCFATLLAIVLLTAIEWITPRQVARQPARRQAPASSSELPLPASPLDESRYLSRPHADSSRAARTHSPRSEKAIPPSATDSERDAQLDSQSQADAPDADRDSLAATPRQLSSEQMAQLRALLRDAYQALRDQKFDEADVRIRTATSLTEGTSAAPSVARMSTLADYVRQFWLGVESGIRRVEGTELTLGEKQVFIVEATPQALVIRAEGRNRTIPRDQLPPEIVLAIADRWFDPQAVSTQVFRGAYMAVDSRFAPGEVRRIWQDAIEDGADLDGMMPLLDDRESLSKHQAD
jgi:hypothetical protein